MNPEARIAELKLEMPPAPKPVAVYKPLVVVGNIAYVSGHGPLKSDQSLMTGSIGVSVDAEFGKAAARQGGRYLSRSGSLIFFLTAVTAGSRSRRSRRA